MALQDEIQEEIVQKAVKFYKEERFGYIDGAMRLGKIKISIDIMKDMAIIDTLIAYPDNRIRESWEQEFIKWGYDSSLVTYTNFSSLHKFIDRTFGLLIIDEFHSCSFLERDYCHQIMTNNKNTKVLGLSGTVSKDTKRLWGLNEIAKYTTTQGIQDGVIADYRINVHFVSLDTKVKTPNKKGRMLSEKQRYNNYTYVINKLKNEGKETMHLLLTRNRLSTASLGKLNHVKQLLEKMKDKRVLVFAGLTDTADRIGIPTYHNKSKDDSAFQQFQREEINHLALAAMGKMGVTYKNLTSVILLNATHNKEETAQMVGRATKLDYINKVADIHIIALDEEAEREKIRKTLSMLDKNKIKYL